MTTVNLDKYLTDRAVLAWERAWDRRRPGPWQEQLGTACLLLPQRPAANGYPIITYREGGSNSRQLAGHVMAFVRYYSEHGEGDLALLPAVVLHDYDVDHLCHVRACVNPEHLQLSAPAKNRAEKLTGSPSQSTARHRAQQRIQNARAAGYAHRALDGEAQVRLVRRLMPSVGPDCPIWDFICRPAVHDSDSSQSCGRGEQDGRAIS